ncbi:hypothetical protein P7K49_038413 [Saguinus oedipus]|uniref:Uncharacterized protein n=1 Tax=Saguinus oedipus TaxID=9490 RepID=A0ABQ9TEK9_SAGOE|nr:hypothetical protein P7K49_038413 [Saguinus oedipus]
MKQRRGDKEMILSDPILVCTENSIEFREMVRFSLCVLCRNLERRCFLSRIIYWQSEDAVGHSWETDLLGMKKKLNQDRNEGCKGSEIAGDEAAKHRVVSATLERNRAETEFEIERFLPVCFDYGNTVVLEYGSIRMASSVIQTTIIQDY